MNCWQQLGLAGPGDKRSIKRAYLARLKVTRPEDDPVAFQQLHEAYEMALARAVSVAVEAPLAQSGEAAEQALVAQVNAIFADDSAWRPAVVPQRAPADEEQPTVKDQSSNLPPKQAQTHFDIDAHIKQVWQLLEAGQQDAARQQLYQDLNDGGAHLDVYPQLQESWCDWLLEATSWPKGASELIFEALGWQQDEDTSEKLNDSWRDERDYVLAQQERLRSKLCQLRELEKVYRLREQSRQTLFDVAAGGKHRNIGVGTAKLLAADRIDYKCRLRGLMQRDVTAIEWMNKNIPGWHEWLASDVRAWLRKPHAVASVWWLIMTIFMAGFLMNHEPQAWREFWKNVFTSDAGETFFSMCNLVLAYLLVRGGAWLRVQLATRIYLPLLAKDKPMTSHVDFLRRLCLRFKLTWLLDGLFMGVAATAGTYFLSGYSTNASSGLMLYKLLLLMFGSWWVWRLLLRFLVAAPGVTFWQQMRDL